jgi:hypothetical protein
VEPPPYDRADRFDALLVFGVLMIDVLLLALVEMMFVNERIAGMPAPVSSLVALVSTPWLVKRAGDLPIGVPAAISIMVAWTATMLLLGFTGPGGDVLMPDSWPSTVLLAAGLVPGALTLGRVLRARRSLY